MTDTQIINDFGQVLKVGDVVGWGHRDGNESVQQIGIVLKLTERKVTINHTEIVARCQWVLSNSWKNNYASATKAGALFVLDTKTLGQAQYDAIVTAADVIAAKAIADADDD